MNKIALSVAAIVVLVLAVAGLYVYIKGASQSKSAVINQSQSMPASPSANIQLPSLSASSEAVNEKVANVSVTDQGFVPATITIDKGTKVIWINNASSVVTVNSDPHPIHTNYPPLNLNSFAAGSSVSLVFDKPGTYGYHNHLNPSQKGTVIVK